GAARRARRGHARGAGLWLRALGGAPHRRLDPHAGGWTTAQRCERRVARRRDNGGDPGRAAAHPGAPRSPAAAARARRRARGARGGGAVTVALNVTGWLSDAQLELLREHGEERAAEVGAVLYRVGDRTYPFIAILAGEAAILDPQGEEIVRHGPHGFLGELNLFSGQTVYVTAVVTERSCATSPSSATTFVACSSTTRSSSRSSPRRSCAAATRSSSATASAWRSSARAQPRPPGRWSSSCPATACPMSAATPTSRPPPRAAK